MNIFISIVAAALMAVSAAPQQTQHSALDKLYAALSESCVRIECICSISVSGTRIQGEASIKVRKDAYFMSGNGLQIYCDGSRVWTMDPEQKEVYIENLGQDGSASLSNPAALFMSLASSFTVDASDLSKDRCAYDLRPDPETGISSAELVLTPEGVILSAVFVLEDGAVAEVDVVSMEVTAAEPVDSFRPQTVFDKDWIVTEF